MSLIFIKLSGLHGGGGLSGGASNAAAGTQTFNQGGGHGKKFEDFLMIF